MSDSDSSHSEAPEERSLSEGISDGEPEEQVEGDAFGLRLGVDDTVASRRVDERRVTLVLHPALVKAYHQNLLGTGVWEKKARLEMKSRYYLGEEQKTAMAPPSLRGSKLYTAVRSTETSGLGKAMLDAHTEVRSSAKILLRVYEMTSAVMRRGQGLGTEVFGADGEVAYRPDWVQATDVSVTEEDEEELQLLARKVLSSVPACRVSIRSGISSGLV